MSQLAANPCKVTSADSLPVTVFTGSAKIRHIEFAGYAAATDNAKVTDINGVDIAILHGNAALETERTAYIGYVTGLKVTICTAGEVTIYFE